MTRPNNCTNCGSDEDTRGGLCYACALQMSRDANGGQLSPSAQKFSAAVEAGRAMMEAHSRKKRNWFSRMFGGGK